MACFPMVRGPERHQEEVVHDGGAEGAAHVPLRWLPHQGRHLKEGHQGQRDSSIVEVVF